MRTRVLLGLCTAIVAVSLAPAAAAFATAGHDPVTICHKPGTPAEQTLVVDSDAVAAHLAHGDHLGACTAATATPTPEPSATPGVPTSTPSPTSTPTPTPTPVPTPTATCGPLPGENDRCGGPTPTPTPTASAPVLTAPSSTPVPQVLATTPTSQSLADTGSTITPLESNLLYGGLVVAVLGVALCLLTPAWFAAADRKRALMRQEVRDALDGSDR